MPGEGGRENGPSLRPRPLLCTWHSPLRGPGNMFRDLSSFKAHLSAVRMLHAFPHTTQNPAPYPVAFCHFYTKKPRPTAALLPTDGKNRARFSRSVTRRFRQPLPQQRGGSPERLSATRPALRSHFKERRGPRCRGRPATERRGCGRAARRRKMEPRAAGRAEGGGRPPPQGGPSSPLLSSPLPAPRPPHPPAAERRARAFVMAAGRRSPAHLRAP